MASEKYYGPSEYVIQKTFCEWMEANWPDIWLFAVPNGAVRSARAANRLKKEGMSPGVPDLFIPALKLFIEFKTPVGRVRPAQREWIEYLNGIGYVAVVCRSVVAAVEQVAIALTKEIDLCK